MRFFRTYLIFVFGLYVLIFFHFVLTSPIWSPIDEIGHYDYIDQLSSGHFPSPAKPISDYTSDLTINRFEWIKPKTFTGTKETMGLAGYSYEAQQPPIYYFLLTLPNLALKAMHIDPTVQIQTLRIINALFEILGAAAGGLVVFRLRSFIKFSPLWVYFVPVVLLIPNWNWRSSLGNGNLSLLMVNLAFFFALGSLIDPARQRNGTMAVLFGSLAFLTNYTNILALGGVLVLLAAREIVWVRNSHSGTPVKRAFVFGWPLLLILVYVGFNILRFGPGDILGSHGVEKLFVENAIQIWGLRFFEQLFQTSFMVNFLPFALPVLPVIIIGTAATTGSLLFYLYKRDFVPGLAWLFILGMTAAIAVCAWLLPKFAPTVDWSFFRHFSGYLLLIPLISFGAFMRPGKYQTAALAVLSAALVVPALFYLTRLSF